MFGSYEDVHVPAMIPLREVDDFSCTVFVQVCHGRGGKFQRDLTSEQPAPLLRAKLWPGLAAGLRKRDAFAMFIFNVGIFV